MLQQVTIKTNDRAILKPLLKSAIENEKKMILIGLERTQKRIAEFEHQYQMSSDEFEQRLNSSQLEETVDFSDWRMEIGMFQILERQLKALQDARLD